MIRFVVGLPGHGKTRFLMERIIDTLLNTKRTVITTLEEINLPRLYEYLREKRPDIDLHLERRLFFVPKLETSEFLRYRGHDTLPAIPEFAKYADTKTIDSVLTQYFGPAIEYTKTRPGVDFFITEAHRHLKADRWDQMSAALSFYFTQHRHFDDNVWIETQLPKQVAIQIRDLCDECVELRNLYRERMGFFRKPGCFRAIWYYSVPKSGVRPEPFMRQTFFLDAKGIASCYATRGAVTGSGRPEEQPKKAALPFWTMFLFAALALAAVPLVLYYGFQGVNYGIARTFGAAEGVLVGKVGKSKESADPVQRPPSPGDKPSPVLERQNPAIRSIQSGNGIVVFHLTDGTLLTYPDGQAWQYQYDRLTGVLTTKDGKKYYKSVPAKTKQE